MLVHDVLASIPRAAGGVVLWLMSRTSMCDDSYDQEREQAVQSAADEAQAISAKVDMQTRRFIGSRD